MRVGASSTFGGGGGGVNDVLVRDVHRLRNLYIMHFVTSCEPMHLRRGLFRLFLTMFLSFLFVKSYDGLLLSMAQGFFF